jgi:4-hydroxyphenylpyruvate dioxygenase
VDFARATEAGQTPQAVVALVRRSGLTVSAVGARLGWMYAERTEREALDRLFADVCRRAAALGAAVVQSPVDFGAGDLATAAARVREMGDLAGRHGLRLALEPYVIARQFNRLDRACELLARAAHPCCGLDVDAYHLHRGGNGIEAVADLAPAEIAYVPFSDVPAGAGPARAPADLQARLPPGQGVVPIARFFQILEAKGYRGPLSSEAPDPAAWVRDPEDVARKARAAALQVAA